MRSFHISCWNIQGLHSSAFELKSRNPEFMKSINDIDIIVLTESDLLTHCLRTGDLNGRTGIYLMSYLQGNNHVFGQAPLFTTSNITCWNNLDSEISPSGRETALVLYIVNGRFRKALLSPPLLGSSVVDYAITDMDPSTISAFTVRQQSPLSDHNQINMFFKLSDQMSDKKGNPVSCFN